MAERDSFPLRVTSDEISLLCVRVCVTEGGREGDSIIGGLEKTLYIFARA